MKIHSSPQVLHTHSFWKVEETVVLYLRGMVEKYTNFMLLCIYYYLWAWMSSDMGDSKPSVLCPVFASWSCRAKRTLWTSKISFFLLHLSWCNSTREGKCHGAVCGHIAHSTWVYYVLYNMRHCKLYSLHALIIKARTHNFTCLSSLWYWVYHNLKRPTGPMPPGIQSQTH